ncbi:MAG: hypothetical protein Q8936_23405 [Bacillota bacterium]|nr:hypothetical protein [Bacillota bacterium]
MKIVSKVFDKDGKKFLVSESLVKTGYFFGEQDDMLLNIEKGELQNLLDNYLQLKDEYRSFWIYLTENTTIDMEFMSLPSNRYVSEDTLDSWIEDNKYFYNANDDSINPSSEVKIYQLCDYIEYWNNGNVYQEEVYIEDEYVDLVESNIYSDDKTSHIDLYRLLDGSYVINHYSYYQGDLGHCEEISEEELKERYNYIVEE